MTIAVRNVSKRFGASAAALDDVSLEIPGGELVALLGPSGSGKTTLLRILAGLEQPDGGSIEHDGVDVLAKSARDRNVGLVFQHYALFRHLDVFENIAFGLRVRKKPKAEIERRVRELLRLIQLDGLDRRLPSQLSGGQRQRVALARALAAAPNVLLLDEPFGALDAQVRQELRSWLRRLHDEIHVTTVFVTHDQEEAFEVADRVVVMNQGKVEQVGSPSEVFDRPASDFVMRFLGQVNVLPGRVARGRARVGEAFVDAPDHADHDERDARVYVRPHELEIETEAGPDRISARVARLLPVGGVLRVELEVELEGRPLGATLRADVERRKADALALSVGSQVWISVRSARVFLDGVRDAA